MAKTTRSTKNKDAAISKAGTDLVLNLRDDYETGYRHEFWQRYEYKHMPVRRVKTARVKTARVKTAEPWAADYGNQPKHGGYSEDAESRGRHMKIAQPTLSINFSDWLEREGLGRRAELGNGNAKAIVREAMGSIGRRYMDETVNVRELAEVAKGVVCFALYCEKAGIKSYTDFYRWKPSSSGSRLEQNQIERNAYVIDLSPERYTEFRDIGSTLHRVESEAMTDYKDFVWEFVEGRSDLLRIVGDEAERHKKMLRKWQLFLLATTLRMKAWVDWDRSGREAAFEWQRSKHGQRHKRGQRKQRRL